MLGFNSFLPVHCKSDTGLFFPYKRGCPVFTIFKDLGIFLNGNFFLIFWLRCQGIITGPQKMIF